MNKKDETEIDIYAEIGGIQCPFLLAKHQGVKLSYVDDIGDDICGIYKSTRKNCYRIYLNSSLDIDTHESVLFLLMKYHNTEFKGIERCVVKDELTLLNKIARDSKRISNMMADIFLKGSLFQNRA